MISADGNSKRLLFGQHLMWFFAFVLQLEHFMLIFVLQIVLRKDSIRLLCFCFVNTGICLTYNWWKFSFILQYLGNGLLSLSVLFLMSEFSQISVFSVDVIVCLVNEFRVVARVWMKCAGFVLTDVEIYWSYLQWI